MVEPKTLTLARTSHLSLKGKHAVEKSFCGWWAAGHVEVDGDDAVATPDD